jgi:hypothetical protein
MRHDTILPDLEVEGDCSNTFNDGHSGPNALDSGVRERGIGAESVSVGADMGSGAGV